MTPRRVTLLTLAALLWIAGAWHVRDVDSDRPTTPPSAVVTGVGEAPAPLRWEAPRVAPTAASRARTPGTDGLGRLNWHALAMCESSGNPRAVSPSGKYRGLYQADATFWRRYGGLRFAARPDLATPAEQLVVAKRGYAVQGRGAWPTCGRRWLR